MLKNEVSVLFVCLGNICRSPTAHGIFQKLVDNQGLSQSLVIDSCGTGDWHIGREPDARSAKAASLRGYDLSHLRARQIDTEDFHNYDYILAMDENNLLDIRALHESARQQNENVSNHNAVTLDLFLRFAGINDPVAVPDPYYGGEQGFETVLDLVEEASQNLLNLLIERHELS